MILYTELLYYPISLFIFSHLLFTKMFYYQLFLDSFSFFGILREWAALKSDVQIRARREITFANLKLRAIIV